VDIGSEPGVIGEIPAWVIWIVVQHDVVAAPQPVAGVVIVVRRDAPEIAAEPETVAASAFDAINVVAANFTAEASVFPNVILMVARIVAASGMTDPLIALRMDVWGFGMALLVAERLTALVATWAPAAIVAALCLDCAATLTAAALIAALWLSRAAGRRRTVSRDVSAANLSWGAALATSSSLRMPATSTLRMPATTLLGECRERRNQKHCKQTR
jgi:hypothetical protein